MKKALIAMSGGVDSSLAAKPCERAYSCRTYPMWTEFHRIVNNYFDGITLADIMKTDMSDNYSI